MGWFDCARTILLTAAFCAQFCVTAGTALGKAATFYLGDDRELFDNIVQYTMAPTPGAHDATTKNHIHVFQSCCRCEIEGGDGDVTVVDVPLKFELCKSGKAASEARQFADAFETDVGGEKLKVPLSKLVGCSSDGATGATARATAELRKTELDEAQKAVDSYLGEHPEELKEAIAAYLDMSDEQRVIQSC